MAGINIPSYDLNSQTKIEILQKDALAFGAYKATNINTMNDAFPVTVINGWEVYGEFDFATSVTDSGDKQGEWLRSLNVTQDELQNIKDTLNNPLISRVVHTWNYSTPTEIEKNKILTAFDRVKDKLALVSTLVTESFCKAYDVDSVLEVDRLPVSFEALYGTNLSTFYQDNDFEIDINLQSVNCRLDQTSDKFRVISAKDDAGTNVLLSQEEKDWLRMIITTDSNTRISTGITKGTTVRTMTAGTQTYEAVQSITDYACNIPIEYMELNWNRYSNGLADIERPEYEYTFDSVLDLVTPREYGVYNVGAHIRQILWAVMEAQTSDVANNFFIRSSTDGKLYLKRLEVKRMNREQIGVLYGNYIKIEVVKSNNTFAKIAFAFLDLMQSLTDAIGKAIDFLDSMPLFKQTMDALVWLVTLFSNMSDDEIRSRLKAGITEVIKWAVTIAIGTFTGGAGWVAGISSATGTTLVMLITELVADIVSLLYTIYDVATRPFQDEDEEDKLEKKEQETKAMVTKTAKQFEDENEHMYNGQFEVLNSLEQAIDKPFDVGTIYNQQLNEGRI